MRKIGIETQRIFDRRDKMPVEKKKELRMKANEFARKSQGKIWFAPGFSFDSDSKVKLYEANA